MSTLPGCQLNVTRKRNDDSCLLKYANEKRLQDWFNDTTIGVGTQRISANRMVLACYSGYFEDKFLIKADFNPSVSITDMDEEPVVKIIEFIYTKEIVINHENVMSLFLTAAKLKVESAIQLCLNYFQSVINMQNYYFILNQANTHKVQSLKTVAYKYMGENFNEVSQSDEFKQLSKSDVSSCISKIDQSQRSEMALYDAIITWTKHNEASRRADFPELFLQLNLDQLPREYLLQVVAEENLVKDDLACYKAVMERYKLLMNETKLNKTESKILSLGGSVSGSKVIEVFSLAKDNPKTYPNLSMELDCHCSVKIDQTILCFGGRVLADNNKTPTEKAWEMDLNQENLEWKEIASMNEKRFFMGAAVYKGALVVAGGYNGKVAIASAEVYTKPLNRWEIISQMIEGRMSHCAVTCAGYLYAIGGYSNACRHISSSVERLSDLKGKWESIQPMQTPRIWFAAVCLKGRIFAIGGNDGSDDNKRLASVEQFDPNEMTWEYVKSLNIARATHSACVLADKIYVFGGNNGSKKSVHEIECYDPFCDEWKIVGNAKENLQCHSVVLI